MKLRACCVVLRCDVLCCAEPANTQQCVPSRAACQDSDQQVTWTGGVTRLEAG